MPSSCKSNAEDEKRLMTTPKPTQFCVLQTIVQCAASLDTAYRVSLLLISVRPTLTVRRCAGVCLPCFSLWDVVRHKDPPTVSMGPRLKVIPACTFVVCFLVPKTNMNPVIVRPPPNSSNETPAFRYVSALLFPSEEIDSALLFCSNESPPKIPLLMNIGRICTNCPSE